MAAQDGRTPTATELQAFALGQLDPQRQDEIEAHLAAHPECLPVVEDTPDDELLRHLRGAGALPRPRSRPWLLQLAVEAVLPVLGGCAGVLVGGAAGGLAGVVAGQVAEKAINIFGQGIVARWLEWLRKQPADLQVAALSDLAGMAPEAARGEVAALLAERAPQASSADRQAAIDYLSAIPRAVRRSLLSGQEKGRRQLLSTICLADSLSLLQLLPADVPPYAVPSVLPGTDYQLEELIGSGGFGAVYRASSPSLQYLPLAIKFCLDRSLLPALQQERANLEQLMKAGGKTWSPRLVRLYGYNLEHRTPHLVYEFVAGGDLLRWLAGRQVRSGQGPTAAETLALIVQVVEALAFAHQRGLVHRDLKPANVLMAADGTIKLADFGIGGLASRQAVQASKIGSVASSRLSLAEQASLFRGAGTPLYMSLEQKQGAAPDPRHDIYSLGVMWYQLLIGDVTREMAHGWDRELEAKFAVPPRHIALIGKCVGWIEERPKDADELLPMLRVIREPATTQKKMAVAPPPPRSPDSETLKPSVPSTAESQRSRQLRFVIGLRQLLECHKKAASVRGLFWPLMQGIILGLVLGLVGGVLLGGMTREFLYETTYNGKHWGVAVCFLSGFVLLGLVIWLRLRFRWKGRLGAQQNLAAKIDEMLAALPQECETWGGRAALADVESAQAILRELEPSRR